MFDLELCVASRHFVKEQSVVADDGVLRCPRSSQPGALEDVRLVVDLVTHYTLHITHYTLHITRYTLHITHYTLHITHYAVFTCCPVPAAGAGVW